MKRKLLNGLALGMALAISMPADAGIFKRTKPNPAERVPALIVTLRTESSERKRESAAEELREFDTAQFPEIIPTLLHALQNDPSSGVRQEAAQSLGKLRPISQQVGLALETAQNNDSSSKVRIQARTSLIQYHWSGYSRKADIPQGATIKTQEPPLAPPLPEPQTSLKPIPKSFVPGPRTTVPAMPTAKPSVPAPNWKPPSTQPVGGYQQMPQGPSQPTLVPASPPALRPPPANPDTEGPELPPSK